MIRQLTIVRKFRNSVNLAKTKNPAKKGKMGVCVGTQKKNLINLQMKIQGGLGVLNEIEENIIDDNEISSKRQKDENVSTVKGIRKINKSEIFVKIGGNLANVITVNNRPIPIPILPFSPTLTEILKEEFHDEKNIKENENENEREKILKIELKKCLNRERGAGGIGKEGVVRGGSEGLRVDVSESESESGNKKAISIFREEKGKQKEKGKEEGKENELAGHTVFTVETLDRKIGRLKSLPSPSTFSPYSSLPVSISSSPIHFPTSTPHSYSPTRYSSSPKTTISYSPALHLSSPASHSSSPTFNLSSPRLYSPSPTLFHSTPTPYSFSHTVHSSSSPTLHSSSPTFHSYSPTLHSSSSPTLHSSSPAFPLSLSSPRLYSPSLTPYSSSRQPSPSPSISQGISLSTTSKQLHDQRLPSLPSLTPLYTFKSTSPRVHSRKNDREKIFLPGYGTLPSDQSANILSSSSNLMHLSSPPSPSHSHSIPSPTPSSPSHSLNLTEYTETSTSTGKSLPPTPQTDPPKRRRSRTIANNPPHFPVISPSGSIRVVQSEKSIPSSRASRASTPSSSPSPSFFQSSPSPSSRSLQTSAHLQSISSSSTHTVSTRTTAEFGTGTGVGTVTGVGSGVGTVTGVGSGVGTGTG